MENYAASYFLLIEKWEDFQKALPDVLLEEKRTKEGVELLQKSLNNLAATALLFSDSFNSEKC